MDIKELAKRLQKVDIDYIKELAVRDSKDIIVNANRDQMRKGLNSVDGQIKPMYSKSWAAYKKTLPTYRAINGVADLFLSGSFQKAMYLIVENGEYYIYSQDSKTGKLKEKYADIFGLNKISTDKIIPFVTLKFNERFKKTIGL